MRDFGNHSYFDRKANIEDSWSSGDAYEKFMGRWSRVVAREFIEWLAAPSGLRWLDVGCGSGALSEAVCANCQPTMLTSIDRSEGFVKKAQERLGSHVRCRVGDACSLPIEDASVDITVSGLVLNFISEPIKALAEMRRATVKTGTVAAYVWDYSGKMEFLTMFWDTVVAIDPSAAAFHERYRFPNSTEGALKGLFEQAGFVNVKTAPIEIVTRFRDFDDYWIPFLGGEGPAPSYLMSLDESTRLAIRDRLFEILPIQRDGSILMESRAWAVQSSLSK